MREKVTVLIHEKGSLLRKSKIYTQLKSHFRVTPPTANRTEGPAPIPLLPVLSASPPSVWRHHLDTPKFAKPKLPHSSSTHSVIDAASTSSSLRLEVTARTSWSALLRASSSSHCDGLSGSGADLSRRDLGEDTRDGDGIECESAYHH